MAAWGVRGWFRTLERDASGYVTIFAAGAMAMLMGAAALGVDVGSVYLAKRQLQGVADAAALAAAGSAAAADQMTAARAAVTLNASTDTTVASLIRGQYTPDPKLDADARFVTAAATDPGNAARVTLNQDVPLFFGRIITGRATLRVAATATAAQTNLAAFSLGTRLAAVQGGMPNALLSALAGTSLNLSVMDYDSLASANIDALAFTRALRTQLQLDAATFGDTLAATATLPQAVQALAAATGSATAATLLRSIALKLPATNVQLSRLIDLGPLASQRDADPANVFSFDGYSGLRAILELANGQRTVVLGSGVSVPGLLSTQISMASGQRLVNSPWLAVAKDNAVTVRTAQTRLYLESQVGGPALLGLASLRVPIFLELASAEATLKEISCPRGSASASVGLDVTPSVGSAMLADVSTAKMNDFTVPVVGNRATIANVLLVANVTGYADVKLGGTTAQRVTFTPDDIAQRRVRTVSTGDLTQGVAASLISKNDLQVKLLGLGLNLSAVSAAVGSALSLVAPALDALVSQVTGLIGVRLGQADVQINGVRCGTAALVA